MRLFDLHCDTVYECYKRQARLDQNALHIDLTRGQMYDPWIQVFAVWTTDDLRGEAAYQHCRAAISFILDQCPALFEGPLSDQPGQGRCGTSCQGIWALESGAALGGELKHIDTFADLGVKIITLTWNGSNELGHGCLSAGQGGLTDFGKQAVLRMQQRGILVDVSHLNPAGFWDVASLIEGPFIASHSLSAAVHPHPRNLTDEQFLEICRRGGLVGLHLCDEHLGEASFEAFERHLSHFLELGGQDVVGLGLDLDGIQLPPEWGDMAVAGQLWEYLSRKGYREELLDKLFFSNCYNFFIRL